MTPTARTLARLRKEGITAQVVERFNPYGGPRKADGTAVGNRVDLFGIIDVICLGGSITGIQATSGANLSNRRQKAEAEPRLLEWLKAGGKFELWGWRKLKRTGRWEVRKLRAERCLACWEGPIAWEEVT